MTQANRLLDYLDDHLSIDPITAWQELGIYRLSATVFTLRSKGFNIVSKRKNVFNRFNEKCRVAEYSLEVE
jgi:hypothetical protein